MIVDVIPPYIIEERVDRYQNILRINDSEPKVDPPCWPKLYWVIKFLCEDNSDGAFSSPFIIPIPDDELNNIYLSSFFSDNPILSESWLSPTPIVFNAPLLDDSYFQLTPSDDMHEIISIQSSEELFGSSSITPASIEIDICSENDCVFPPVIQSINELPDSLENKRTTENTDFVQIASVLITYVFLPSFINLLNAYLFEKLHKSKQKSFEVKLDFSVKKGRETKKVIFKGPITSLKEAMDIVNKMFLED